MILHLLHVCVVYSCHHCERELFSAGGRQWLSLDFAVQIHQRHCPDERLKRVVRRQVSDNGITTRTTNQRQQWIPVTERFENSCRWASSILKGVVASSGKIAEFQNIIPFSFFLSLGWARSAPGKGSVLFFKGHSWSFILPSVILRLVCVHAIIGAKV